MANIADYLQGAARAVQGYYDEPGDEPDTTGTAPDAGMARPQNPASLPSAPDATPTTWGNGGFNVAGQTVPTWVVAVGALLAVGGVVYAVSR